MPYIISSGEISEGIILENDIMTILDGGIAATTTVESAGSVYISSGGVANSATVNRMGEVHVCSSGLADVATLNNGGKLYVSEGGTANGATLYEGGALYVSSGGLAGGAIVSEWGMMNVYKDGLADAITVESAGRLYVSRGATASNTTVGSSGCLYVSRGATASGAMVESGGILHVSSGATMTGLAADSGASLNFYLASGTYIAGTYDGSAFVIGDGAVSNYTVNNNVKLYVSSGCTADVITVNGTGELRIRGGAAANGVTVNGGALYVQNSGTATDIVWTPCEGHVYVYDGGYATFVSEYSGVYYGSGNKLLSNTTVMDGKTLDASFEMYVMNGGTADSAMVNDGGMLYVQDGGVADNTTVNGSGSMVCSGGTANHAAVNDGGRLYVSVGGTANHAAVNDGGRLYVSAGGVADSAAVNDGGSLIVSSGGTAFNIAVEAGGEFYVYSSGMAADVTADLMGYVYISDGGTATGILENGGYVEVLDSATVTFRSNTLGGLVLEDGRYVTLHSNTTATSAVLNFDGGLFVRGGRADHTTVNDGGELQVSDGQADGITVNSDGSVLVVRTGTAAHATINSGGSMLVSYGGKATDAAVHDGGALEIGSGGSVLAAAVDSGGSVFVDSGGTAADISVRAGGRLEIGDGGLVQAAIIQSGGLVTGHVDCGDITFDPGATLQFDLSAIQPGNESALVNLAGLTENPDCPSFSLLVTDSQAYGDYKLAEDAWGFEEKTISVSNSVMEFGSLSPDRSMVVGNREYTLNLNDGDLFLSVNAARPTRYVYLDFDGEELVRYGNPDLALSFDLSVADPALSEERRAAVVSALSEQYGKYNIAFTLERPEGADYSTLYFGVSSAFDEYGDFFGIAETCDANDRVRNDNAFVLLDSGYSDEQILSVASHMLDLLMGFSYSGSDNGSPAILRYAESKALLSLSAGWNQKYPYNKYCPIDPETGDRCVVGCTNTAASQIIYYWLEKDLLDFSLTLTDSDAYRSNEYIVIESSDNPESGHLSFAETNVLLQSFDILDENCIAALCFAAGVVQQADYSSGETGTAWRKKLFVRSGFEIDEAAEQYAVSVMFDDYDILVYELLHGRPVGISLLKQEHAIVVDGYDSSTNMFHMDFGWGNDSNRWYTREEMENLRIYVEVSGYTPVVSPDLTIEDLSAGTDVVYLNNDVTLSFTVSNEGREASAETMAYVYCGDAIIGACGLDYISPGFSRDYSCTVNTATLQVGENTLTVKVGSQNDEGSISVACVTVTARNSDVLPQTQIWEAIAGAAQYIVEYSPDATFEQVIRLVADSNALDSYQLPGGDYQVRVKPDNGDEWTVIEPVAAEKVNDDPKLVRSDADGNADAFYVNPVGVWERGYAAQHVGSADDTWSGTKELVVLLGRNKLTDIIEGSTDANTLLMTDDANGDALFVDDIYSASPGELGLNQSRIARIDEIRAGAGVDIVDMTSNKFEYTGDGLTIRGGDGNDVIWANRGDNRLFGDAGNDRIVGASGDDVIVGGSGNDRMHGGGGEDIFTFCENWGVDSIEQLAGDSVTLWFTAESEGKVVWDEVSKSYTDGKNSVKVSGVSAEQVTLKFGAGATPSDAELFAALSDSGAFLDFTSQKIFEESGFLAGQ